MSNLFGIDGNILLFSKKFSVLLLLKLTSNFATYPSLTNFSSLISNESIKLFIVVLFIFSNFFLSLEVVTIDVN